MDSYYLTSFKTHQSQETIPLGALTIRSAQEKDIKGLTSVLLKSFHPTSTWLYPVLRIGVYEDIKGRLNCKLPYYKCLVASGSSKAKNEPAAEEIVGTIEVALRPVYLFGDCLPYVSNLAVSETSRRQGVGYKLLERCEQIVSEWGFKEIWLHVLENNTEAKHLYKKRGYTVSKTDLDWGNIVFNQPRKLLLLKKL